MRSGHSRLLSCLIALSAGVALPACSGGGGGGGEFQITSINLRQGDIWRINKQIKISFSKPVDFASINLNTVNVRQVGGGPTAGEFWLENGDRTVVFQPLCPTKDDLSDAGLKAGSNPLNNGLPYAYELNIIGVDLQSQLTVRSTSGDSLRQSQTRQFTTPVSLNPLDLYLDTKVGPPVARVIGDQPDTDTSNGTHIEIGGSGGQKHYFERQGGVLVLNPPIDLPLNKLSEPESQVALIVGIDQAVSPSSFNLDPARLSWQFQDSGGAWVPLTTDLELEQNCTRTGARIRITPLGLLPHSTNLRVVMTPEFADIVGETNLVAQNNFANASTEPFPTNPALLVDHLLEDFDTPENNDVSAPFSEPPAEWGDGVLGSKFSFGGSGGPGGDFDWYIAAGEQVIFNTANSTISGYDIVWTTPANGGFDTNTKLVTGSPPQTGVQTVVGGIVDVRYFYLGPNATLKIEGPNPFMLLATGEVVINGTIVVSGTNNAGVVTLNTTNIPEIGSPGQAGGGRGGTGSPLTTASSPRGGNGFGAWNTPDLGGQGGETGWSATSSNVGQRRGAGGGGGVFGPTQLAPSANQTAGCTPNCAEQRRIGFDAEPGFVSAADNGATTGSSGPFGGLTGPSPFNDPNPNNNFYGTQFDFGTSALTVGELVSPWAGAGGGGGGDASRVPNGGSFPPNWNAQGDEKGSGGAGGGGSFQVLSIGAISFGQDGLIRNRGGIGGGGENTSFVDRVGGGSGGGSGGHVVLQTATAVDFTRKTPVQWTNSIQNTWAIDCRGGQGGAGANDIGGGQQSPTGQKETTPLADSCPPNYPTSGTNACKTAGVDGAGGDGGPGIIQIHTSIGKYGPALGPNADILIAPGVTVDTLCAPIPLCVNNTLVQASSKMVPVFGRTSRARSTWFALGEGGFNPSAPQYKNVTFAFGGVDTVTGLVQTTAGDVNMLPAVIAPAAIDLGGVTAPYVVTPGGFQAVLDASSLVGTTNEALLRDPALLTHYMVVLSNGGQSQRFDVVDAEYTAANQTLLVTIDGDGPSMFDFGLVSGVTLALHPAYFRVTTSGTTDFLPTNSSIQITLEATTRDPLTGQPNTAAIIGPTSNVSLLNTAPNNRDLRFVRFGVLFDIGPLSSSNPIPTLEFFRLPFSYQ